MKSADFTFQTVDGAKLHVNGWTIDNAKAVVQVIHGLAEYGSRYARIAQALADAGYNTYAHDHRGHGKSIPEGQPPGHMADEDAWNRIVEDSHGVNREIAKRHPNLPIIVLGHSMGSFVLQQLLFEHPSDMIAASLSASNGKPPAIAMLGKLIARIERLRVGKRNPSPVMQKLTFDEYNKAFAPNRTTFDWLSRDDHEVDIYVADPLLGFAASTQTWIDMLDGLSRISNPKNISRVPQSMPIYLFAGSEDPVGNMGKGMRNLYDTYKRAGIFDVRLKLYDDARHETLNETNRQEVTDDFIAWCGEVLTAHG
ncbi:MAG: lysophospholipase [Deltaproteobacteria bacterium]|nr:lysophospholipase [Deltaproteobacteria bacterium]